MQQVRRRTTRAILVPLALLILVIGSSLPASAAGVDQPEAPAYVPGIVIGPLSIKW
jgi:hypothetical protein